MGGKSSCQRALTDQGGSVLLGGLLLVAALTVLGIGLFKAVTIETQDVVYTERDVRAFYAADAGLSQASADLAITEVGTTSLDDVVNALVNSTPVPAFDGSTSTCFGSASCTSSSNPRTPAYLVQVAAAPGSPMPTDRLLLTSTACIPGPATNPCPATATAAAQIKSLVVKTTVTGPTMPWAIAGGSTTNNPAVKITGGGTVDSYSSHATCTGPIVDYASATHGQDGDILANGGIDIKGTFSGDVVNTTNVSGTDVTIESGSTVTGNVTYAGTGTLSNSGTVDGTIKQQAQSPVSLVNGTLPNCGPYPSSMASAITQYDGSGNVVPQSHWTYSSSTGALTISTGSPSTGWVSIAPGSYCLGSITVSGGSLVKIIDSPTPTVLTANGKVDLSGGTIANTSLDPENFQLISTYGNDPGETSTNFFTVSSGGTQAYMVIYAPYTKVTISGGGNIYGAVVGNTVEASGGSHIHYDEFFKSGCANKLTVGIPGTTNTTYALQGWQQLHCSQASPSSSWTCS